MTRPVRIRRGDIEPPNGANAALGERRQRDFSASGSFSIISAGLTHLGLKRDLRRSGAKDPGRHTGPDRVRRRQIHRRKAYSVDTLCRAPRGMRAQQWRGLPCAAVHRSVSQGNPGAAPNGSPAGVERCVVRYPMTNHSGRCLRQELLHSPVRPAHLPLMNSHRNSELVSPG